MGQRQRFIPSGFYDLVLFQRILLNRNSIICIVFHAISFFFEFLSNNFPYSIWDERGISIRYYLLNTWPHLLAIQTSGQVWLPISILSEVLFLNSFLSVSYYGSHSHIMLNIGSFSANKIYPLFACLVPFIPLLHTCSTWLNHCLLIDCFVSFLPPVAGKFSYSFPPNFVPVREEGPSLPSDNMFSIPLSQKSLIHHKLLSQVFLVRSWE